VGVVLVVAMLVDGKRMRTIWIESGGEVSVIDQRELPHNLVTRTIATHEVRCRLLFRVRGVWRHDDVNLLLRARARVCVWAGQANNAARPHGRQQLLMAHVHNAY
jgi:hypothetical protein